MILSPYRRGADDGAVFGVYLTVLFFGMIFGSRVPGLGFLSLILALGVPLVIFLFMRRYDRQMQGCATFPMMWMQGVVIFVCGMLIAGTLMVVYMKWVEPDFILHQLEGLVETGSLPEAKGTFLEEAADVASQMIKAKFIPSPMAVVSELIMGAIVSGSLLSILLASYFALRHKLERARREGKR